MSFRKRKSHPTSHICTCLASPPYPSQEPRLKTASALIMLLSIVWAYKSVTVHLLRIVFIGKECIGGFSSNRVYFCAFNFFLIFNFFQIFNFFCAKREYQFPECASELLQSLFYFCSSQPLHRLTASYLWLERHTIYNVHHTKSVPNWPPRMITWLKNITAVWLDGGSAY